jgi:16S rRNA (cytidine1402-2'-O)-methyltransferase
MSNESLGTQHSSLGTLYVLATPIGNLEDITLRALRVLSEVGLIAAEDTRTARKLLTHHGIKNRLVSYTEHNMHDRTPQVLAALETGDVALVSEAGTPGVSDPGRELIAAAIEAGYRVEAVPGASALLAALVPSGLPMREFTFLAFLPRKPGDLRKKLASLADRPETLVVFESPRRVRFLLEAMREAWGDRRLAACRELTKLHEEIFRGAISEALAHFTEPRGEFTLVIEGATAAPTAIDEDMVRARLAELQASGMSARDAVRTVVEQTGAPRREVYRLSVNKSSKALGLASGGPSTGSQVD